jgi:hypothetical protein
MARPPETTILAPASSGRLDLTISSETKRAFVPSSPHGDHLLGVRRLDGLQRVAGIDRPHEGVGADHLDDLGDRRDVELGRNPWREVLADRGGRNQDGVIVGHELKDGRGHGLGHLLA